MEDLHTKMLAAVLAGEGLHGITALAAEELGGPVAIVLPARGLADASSEAVTLAELTRFVSERMRGERPPAPAAVELARPVETDEGTMGFVLALIAREGSAGIDAFTEEALEDAELRAFSERVEMVLDKEVDAAYPQRWIGVVDVETSGGERFTSRVEVPKGDPGNTLSRAELEEKARNLAAYGGGASGEEIDQIVARIWSLDEEADVRDLLPSRSA